MKNLARKNLTEVAEMNLDNYDDPRFLKIKTDVSQFIAETADRANFSKRVEEVNNKQPINISINSYKKIPARIEKLQKELQAPKG
jgi:hypothetical protein